MVKLRENFHHPTEDRIYPDIWFDHIAAHHSDENLAFLRSAYALAEISGQGHATHTGVELIQEGLAMADILDNLNLDIEAISAALLYPAVRYADLSLSDVSEQISSNVAKLISGVISMDSVRQLYHQTKKHAQQQTQVDHLRKMLLSMVDDIRVVLIKLAGRVCVLRQLISLDKETQLDIAKEIQAIYAPLANRLGVAQIKWELEDLAFRYLEEKIYKDIARNVDMKRSERELYIKNVIAILKQKLAEHHMEKCEITGRAKHIFSIYKKMQRKKIGYDQIYDSSAVRVLVENIENCYTVLGLVHSLWPPIKNEFDDYIQQPKENGYRSLHTAVIGPQNKNLEIQIRTYQMHQEAELGVAAHWIYKENNREQSTYDDKIAWLRQVMDWQKEVSYQDDKSQKLTQQIFNDRIYVFSPKGEIYDMPNGATPLDFAYHIHTEIGHRCKGAKVNEHIVPLSYPLNTGDRVVILTGKKANPSRDWLNPNIGYLTTSRAKAKVHHWFKKQDYEKNILDGEAQLERELKRLQISDANLEDIAKKFNYKNTGDFLAGLGAGDVRLGQVIHTLETLQRPDVETDELESLKTHDIKHKNSTGILICGVGNLLVNIANCCQPVPGDSISGYITTGRGVSIHRQDCPNILALEHYKHERLIEVEWGKQPETYPVDISITAHDRQGLIRDITTILSNEQINLINFNSSTNKHEHHTSMNLSLEIPNLNRLSRLLDKIQQLPNVINVFRKKMEHNCGS